MHLNLSLLDAKVIFVTSQKEDGARSRTTIDFDEFVVALALY